MAENANRGEGYREREREGEGGKVQARVIEWRAQSW